ncbi:hypothetical protein LCGC14_0458740 [marine sediment metagenome]|uniref:Uncharacterized protein n=1 Tax=marine sediment metagenome TaxID=412755 RepID=A0A0F9V2I7_9ZZZZ
MKIYLVAFIRENKIDSVMKLTKSKTAAQQALIHHTEKSTDTNEAGLLIDYFSDGILDENATVNINDELNLQMVEFEIEN